MSALQTAAARINGAKSQGPVTSEGKARSSQNAIRHGLTGGPVVLPTESQEEYDELVADFMRSFCPANGLERELVLEMAVARWRLRRIDFMETALMNAAIARQRELQGDEVDILTLQAMAFADLAENSKGLRLVERYGRTLRRSFEKAWQELLRLQQARAGQNEPEPNEPEPNEPTEPDYSVLQTIAPQSKFLDAVLPYLDDKRARLKRAA